MKTYTSVASLAMKLTWLRTILIFAAVAVVQYFVARSWLLPGGVPLATGQAFEAIADALMGWGVAGFIALALALTYCGSESRKSRPLYTLRRLGISENRITAVFALVFTGYFLMYWVMELGIVLGLYGWYKNLLSPGPNALMLACWRSDWLHLLLPLQEWTGYLRNAAACVSCGCCAAISAHQMRHKRVAILVLAPVSIAVFDLKSAAPGMMGSDIAKTILMLAATVAFALVLRGGAKDEEIL